MFFRQIEDFEKVFRFLDRINIIVFNVWRDKNADAFKNGEMKNLESFYRTYISDMREKSNEMLQLKNAIDEQLNELSNLEQQLNEICASPDIQGCSTYCAFGYTDRQRKMFDKEYFVVKYNENPEEVASERCLRLLYIERIQMHRSY